MTTNREPLTARALRPIRRHDSNTGLSALSVTAASPASYSHLIYAWLHHQSCSYQFIYLFYIRGGKKVSRRPSYVWCIHYFSDSVRTIRVYVIFGVR